MSQTTITINWEQLNAAIAQEVSKQLDDINDSAQKTADGGFASLTKGAADMVMGIQGLIAGVQTAVGMIGDMADLGKETIRANEALGAMSGGQTVDYLNAMRTASGGVIDNMKLAQDATLALSTGVVKSSADMSRLVEVGSMLGEVFQGEAQTGVETLTRDLEMVGSTRGLKQLGLDATAVKNEFEELKKSGMNLQDAWNQAVMDQAGAKFDELKGHVSGTGDALERLNAQIENLKQKAGENIAISIEAIINFVQAGSQTANTMGEQQNTVDALAGSRSVVDRIMAAQLQRVQDSMNVTVPYMPQYLGYSGGQDTNIVPSASQTPGQMLANTQNNSSLYLSQDEIQKRNAMAETMAFVSDRKTAPMMDTFLENTIDPLSRAITPLANDLSGITDRMQGVLTLQKAWGEASDFVAGATGRINAGLQVARQEIQQVAEFSKSLTGAFDASASSDLSGAFSAQRNALIQKDRYKSKSTQESDLALFDQQQVTLTDDMNIALGKTTPQAVAMKNALADISKEAASGKISLAQATAEITNLGIAAQHGMSDMDQLDRALMHTGDRSVAHQAEVDWGQRHGSRRGGVQFGGDPGDGTYGTASTPGSGTASDPFASGKRSADDLTAKIDSISNTALPAMSTAAQTAGNGLVSGLSPAQTSLKNMQTMVDGINGSLDKLNRNVTITISSTGAVSGGRHGGMQVQ